MVPESELRLIRPNGSVRDAWIAGWQGAIRHFSGPPPPPVNQPPAASFTFLTTGLAVSLTDTSSDADGTIVSWLWSFGDDTTSTEQHPTHVFALAGTYIVTIDPAGGVVVARQFGGDRTDLFVARHHQEGRRAAVGLHAGEAHHRQGVRLAPRHGAPGEEGMAAPPRRADRSLRNRSMSAESCSQRPSWKQAARGSRRSGARYPAVWAGIFVSRSRCCFGTGAELRGG